MALRILVVDDEEPVQQMLQDFLQDRGYEVLCASSGEEAVQLLDSHRPEAALIDFLLPRMNGFAVADAIRKHSDCFGIPIVMMSGVFKNPKTAVEAREKFQVVDFIAKPLDLALIEHLLQSDADRGTSGPIRIAFTDEDEVDALEQDRDSAFMTNSASMDLDVVAASVEHSDGAPSGLELDLGSRDDDRRSRMSMPTAESRTSQRPSHASDRPSGRPSGRPSVSTSLGGVVRGRPFDEILPEGSLDDVPVALLLSTVRYDRLTGMLDATSEGTHRRMYILEGRPVFMQSNAEGENVGALLLRRGRITDPDFDRCLQYMRVNKRTMQRALLELRLATEQELATAYKLLAGQLLPAAIGMQTGTFKWRETDAFVGRVPEGKFEPVSVLFDGIKRHVHPPQILKFFSGREDVPLMRTVEFSELLPFFRRTFSANNIAAQIDGHASYREIVRSRPRDQATVIPQLFALVTSGMTVLPEVNSDNEMDVAVRQAAAEVAGLADGGLRFDDDSLQLQFDDDNSAPGDFTEQENRARARIRAGHDQYMSCDFFQILDVQMGVAVNPTEVKDTYFQLVKQWHTDAFAGLRLGPEDKLLQELFQRITDAYDTLSDPAKLQEYEVYLDRKAKGLPTDVAQVFEAERLLDEAIRELKRKDYQKCKQLLNKALDLNPAEALVVAYLGWVTFKLGRSSQAGVSEAIKLLTRATEMQPNLPLAYQFLGEIHYHLGKPDQAKHWFRTCLQYDPKNIEATRNIRLINQRAEKGKASRNSGFLGRFLSKK